jgi:lauroyl/myristoyl acyltransferase
MLALRQEEKGPLRALLTFYVYWIIGGLVGHLPARAGYRLAKWAGLLLYHISPRLRSVLEDNIRHVVGPGVNDEGMRSLVRQACVNITKGHYDLFRVGRLSAAEVEKVVTVEGWHHLVDALSPEQGALVFSAHLGNVDLVIQLAVFRGLTAVAPVQRIKPERLFQYTKRLRESHGMQLLPSDEPMIGLFRALKRGAIVGLGADRNVTDNASKVLFFGEPTFLPDGPVRVALRTGAPLIPAFAIRFPDDTFQVTIEPPLALPRTEDGEADVAAGMELVVAALERHIGQHPEQWLVAQPVWPAP